MRKVWDAELKVGLFIMAALAGLVIFVFKAGDFYLKPAYELRFLFESVSGLTTGSPVRLAGVEVGEVTAIKFLEKDAGKTLVAVTVQMEEAVAIEKDAAISIQSLGLLGEKYIEVEPGQASEHFLSGDTAQGTGFVTVDQMTQSGHRLISKLESTAGHLQEIVSQPEFKQSVAGTFREAEGAFGHTNTVMKDLAGATEDLKEAAASTRVVMKRLEDGEGTAGRLLKDDTIVKDLEALVKDLKAHPWKLLKKR